MRRILIISLLVFIFSNFLYGQVFPVKTIFENGPRDNRINIVFLGDGYRITEMDKYNNDVQNTVDKIFNESPYKEYKNLFNVYAIEVPSNESGTDHPGKASDCPYKDSVFKKDTYFNTTFDAGGIHRLLIPGNYTALNNVLINNFPDYDMVLMVVNHPWYGGSGGTISVFSTDTQSAEIAIHEAGHSFAKLADEYEYGANDPVQYEGINVTWRTQRELIPWKEWILKDTPIPTPNNISFDKVVGLFEGAYYRRTGMFRPKFRCKMKELNVPFCEVCREQHVKSMFSYVDLIEELYPEEETVTLFTNSKLDFNVDFIQLPEKNISIEWTIDNYTIGYDTNNISMDGSSLSIGKHTLVVTTGHNTEFVRNDPNNLLQSKASWMIDVVNPTGVEEENNMPREYVLEQNYPNPFNPETLIGYRLPIAGYVTLKVYDALGRELITLVDEFKQPGYYSYQLSTNNFQPASPMRKRGEPSSGVYFYTLRAGTHSITKKMILLR